METFEQRLKRYVTQSDLDMLGWLAVNFQNSYAREIKVARTKKLYLSVYLLTHAVMQRVSENMFDLTGLDGTKFFLSHYVDGADNDKKFSLVADEIHSLRNILAHQGYSSLQHRVEYFSDHISEGWKKDAGTIHVNPDIYAHHFEDALTEQRFISEYEQQSAEVRKIRKYRFIRQWLKVDKASKIAQEVKKLEGLSNMPDFHKQEPVVQRTILASYKIT